MNDPSSSRQRTVFFRLGREEDKGKVLLLLAQRVRGGDTSSLVYVQDPKGFENVPRATFCYWVSAALLRMFRELPPFEEKARTVKVGLQSSDDFRFFRCWWEIRPQETLDSPRDTMWAENPVEFQEWCTKRTFDGKKWVPIAKGGKFSPFYFDLQLVANWAKDGHDIKNFTDPRTGRTRSRPQNTEWYFLPGLTYPYRLHRLAVSPLPAGSIPTLRGPAVYVPPRYLYPTAALYSSSTFDFLVKTMLGRFSHPQFDIEPLRMAPVPAELFTGSEDSDLTLEVRGAIETKMQIDTTQETSHRFVLPPLLVERGTLQTRRSAWEDRVLEARKEVKKKWVEIDRIMFDLYEILEEDRTTILSAYDLGDRKRGYTDDNEIEGEDAEHEEKLAVPTEPGELAARLLSYCIGCAFGRWDIRYGTGERKLPDLADPFAPLPVCSPGMLTDKEGLPVRSPTGDYPLSVAEDGILVVDRGHPHDFVARTRSVLELIFRDGPEAAEGELLNALRVQDLRIWFRNSFFKHHIGLYSAGARNAPIYWPLTTPDGQYTIWLYSPKYTKDTLHYVSEEYLKPKLRMEGDRVDDLRSQTKSAARADRRQLEDDLQRQEGLLADLGQLEQDLLEAANLNLDPDHDDGAILNLAPLHKMIPTSGIPWKGGKGPVRYWEELLKGKYPWSTISKQLSEANLVARD